MTNINDTFRITFQCTLKNLQQITFDLPAAEFFDEGGSYIDSEKWTCILPWEKEYLADYLDLKEEDRKLIDTLVVDIVDKPHKVHRRIIERHWDGHRLLRDFKDIVKHPNKSLLILELFEADTNFKQIVCIQLSENVTDVESHLRFWGKPFNEEHVSFNTPRTSSFDQPEAL